MNKKNDSFPVHSYYEGAAGAILVYDITDRETFNNLSFWLDEIRKYADSNVVLALVGNKTDLKDTRTVTYMEAKHFACTLTFVCAVK